MPEPAERPEEPPEAVPTQAAHDTSPPEALLEFMMRGWDARPPEAIAPIDHHEYFAARRAALSAKFAGATLIIPTGHEKIRANDTTYRFRPGSDFFYLTGNTEADCVLVLEPIGHQGHRSILFVEPVQRDDASFFTDRHRGEFWVGRRLGVEGSRVRYAVDEARPLAELATYLAPLADRRQRSIRVLRAMSPDVDREIVEDEEHDTQFAETLSEMRLVKDAIEIEELQRAVHSTQRGFEDVIRALPGACGERRGERVVEGVFGLRARVEGNDVGYGTIAAAGHHACTLHWTRNDGPLKPGELLLLDAGVEGDSLYTADVTRTLPISGRFTAAQRRIYDLVYRAQRAAVDAVRPGVDFLEPNRVAMRILAHGLEALGILADAEDALREDRRLYRRYTLHNVSHMLGLDVHDCAKARQQEYKYGALKEGMVLTVEPGLYFQPDDLTVPEEYRGIGIRIEDDVLVTAHGVRNLSGHIPAAADAVEDWIRAIWQADRH